MNRTRTAPTAPTDTVEQPGNGQQTRYGPVFPHPGEDRRPDADGPLGHRHPAQTAPADE